MSDNIESLRGEYRRFTSAEIGGVIRMFRELHGIKLAVLATEANVSEKTIERAEGGEGVSEDSCRRIARPLGMKENAFTDELYIPNPEEAARIQKQNAEDFQRIHRAVSVTSINGPRDILPLFRCYALIPDEQCVADKHLHDFAALKQALVDYGDISGDLSTTEQLKAAEEFVKMVREFEALGYVVKCGIAADYRMHGDPWPCSVLVAFKKLKGSGGAPEDVWLPKRARMG